MFTDLIDKEMESGQVRLFQIRVDLGVIAMKSYFTDRQNWSITIRCNLVSYPQHSFFFGGGILLQRIQSVYSTQRPHGKCSFRDYNELFSIFHISSM